MHQNKKKLMDMLFPLHCTMGNENKLSFLTLDRKEMSFLRIFSILNLLMLFLYPYSLIDHCPYRPCLLIFSFTFNSVLNVFLSLKLLYLAPFYSCKSSSLQMWEGFLETDHKIIFSLEKCPEIRKYLFNL